MKKIINIFIIFMVFCLIAVPSVFAQEDGYSTEQVLSCAKLTHEGQVTYYNKLGNAINAAKDGDTVTLLRTTSIEDFNDNSDLTYVERNATPATFTIDLDGHYFTKGSQQDMDDKYATFYIKDGSTVTITDSSSNPGIIMNITYNEKPIMVVESGTLKLENVKCHIYSRLAADAIQVGKLNGTDEAKLIVNSGTEIYAAVNSTGIRTYGSNTSVIIEDMKFFDASSNGIAINGKNNHVEIKKGTIDNGIKTDSSSENADINICGGVVKGGIELWGESPHLVITDGKVDATDTKPGVRIMNANATVDVKGGTILGDSGIWCIDPTAIVNISGGNIISEVIGNKQSWGTSVGVFFDGSKLNISGGNISGGFGIIVIQGEANISGGSITALESGPNKTYTNRDHSYDSVGAVLVDNVDTFYQQDASVNVTGGYFSSADETTLVSVANSDSEFIVGGGIFDKPFNEKFVIPDELELSIVNQNTQLWYVGEDAEEAAESEKNNSTAIIEVINGDFTLENATPGLTVKNLGTGVVTANGIPIAQGEEIIIPEEIVSVPEPTPPDSDQSGGNSGEIIPDSEPTPDRSNQSNGGDVVPSTGDNILTFISLLGISFVGMIVLIYVKKKISK